MKDLYCVVMAGGIGSRFWPMSKTHRPKQFLDFLGTGRTLIQQTFDRFIEICPVENFLVVTNAIYKEQVLEQLPDLKESQVLCEPLMRNTAPCIAYANWKIQEKNPNATVVVTPADHLILKQERFISIIKSSVKRASETDQLITLGITPTRPDTGYGYIETDPTEKTNTEFLQVKQFREKPDLETAEKFVTAGNFSWNSGMFIWSLKSIQRAFDEQLPEINALFAEGSGLYFTEKEQEFIDTIYPQCTSISVDYGIMEKSSNVYVTRADIGWSDLGTWGSVYEHFEHDENGNATNGKNTLLFESRNNMICVPDDKLVVTHGLEDFIVVEADNTLIIVKKENEQAIKQVRAQVQKEKGEQYI